MTAAFLASSAVSFAADESQRESSYSPVVIKETFNQVMAKDKAAKDNLMKRHMDLLNERYDLKKNDVRGFMRRQAGPLA
jgi:hypothetical protein